LSSATGWDASFDVGLMAATGVSVNPPVMLPGFLVPSGTHVTITALAFGSGTLYYQWQTDGGSGGTLTNVPSATSTNLTVDTTGMALGTYRYDLVVTNSSSSVTSSVAALTLYQSSSALLNDVGTSIQPASYDISQLAVITSGDSYDGLNYYDNNNPAPGQTFTTGANAPGYYLTSVALGTGGGTSGHTAEIKSYHLYIYSVSGSSATLVANFVNTDFSFIYGDWVSWSGFTPLLLEANTTYAYAFQLVSDSVGGWAGMGATNGLPYTGGQICLIPPTGGNMTFGPSGTFDAAFDLGLTPVGVAPTTPFANSITVSPSLNVTKGTQVTLAEAATGATPLYYQWQTDGGSGGALTNIPSNNVSNLVVNTTSVGVFSYDVIVTNIYGSSTSAVVSVAVSYPVATTALADLGAAVPIPAADDIYQTNLQINPSYPNRPDNLNYYYNNDDPPGQTFTTGSHPTGYSLNTVDIDLAGDGSLAAQTYVLRIYTVSGDTAALYATYDSPANFLISVGTDCLEWSGLALPLAPNTTYAYSFRGGDGWDSLANVSGNPYPGGEVCLIPPTGGAIFYGASHDYDGVFVLGITLPGYPVVSRPVFSPGSSVYAGTRVTASSSVTGAGPFTYQWQTDGGNGTFTNIPNATNLTFPIDTTALAGMTVGYGLIVSNSVGGTIGEVAELTVGPNQAPMTAIDITNSLDQLTSQVTTFVGGTVTFSDTYFQGTLPITYQWQADGGTGAFSNIPGATNDILTLSNLAVSASGNYQLVATNSQGSAQTSAANLTVLPQPTNPFIVNFQYQTMVNADVGNYAGLGVIGTGTYWNQMIDSHTGYYNPGSYYTASGALSDDGTTNRGISWTIICNNSWGWTSTPAIALLDSAANAYIPSTFQFALPSGLYNLVLFSCNGTEAGNGQGGAVFTVNGASQSTSPTTDTSFILNHNYVVYTGVVVSGATLTGTWYGPNNYGSLNGAQLQYFGPYVPLSIQITNSQLELQWSPGTLLEATNLTGPWITNTASSPYLVTPSGAQMFFRVKVQ
jgi:hypothetical protein